jgi:CDP-diacylglycerol---serine O-phosphatidyltransferase
MADHEQELSSKFYPLPCMFTLASLFCGFYSILASAKGDFSVAAIAIIIAGVFDGLDGRIARMTNTTSLFGKELDSLCDIVSFGVAPAVLAYYWALLPYGRYGWLAAFLYVATTSLRLARFNSQKTSSKYFTGLPCPAAAGTISASVLFCSFLGFSGEVTHISLLLLVYLLSYLMVSNHRYSSFKQPPEVSRIRTFQLLVGMVLLFVLIAAEPQVMLFALAMLYIPSGPIYGVFRFLRRRSAHAEVEPVADRPAKK